MHATSGLLRLSVGLVASAPLLMLGAREIPPTLLIIVALCLGAAAYREGCLTTIAGDLRDGIGHPFALALAGLMVLAVVSVTWSPIPGRAASHALHFSGGVLLGIVAVIAVLRLHPTIAARILGLLLVVAAGVLAADMWFSGALREGLLLSTRASRLNRAAVALVLFLPLATLVLTTARHQLLLAAVWIATVAAVVLSESYSAKLALGLVILLLPIAWIASRMLRRAAMIGLPLAVMAMPVIASFANDLVPERIHDAVGYSSLTIRGEIWRETVPFIAEKPLLGWGLEASRALAHLPEAAALSRTQRELLNWGHTHNAPLQLWLELGFVGAALAAASLFLGIRALRNLPPPLLPYAMTTIIAAFAVACISHGAWQAWWWAFLGLLATAFAMAVTTWFPEAIERAREASGREPA